MIVEIKKKKKNTTLINSDLADALLGNIKDREIQKQKNRLKQIICKSETNKI